jgi:hypothetical protein
MSVEKKKSDVLTAVEKIKEVEEKAHRIIKDAQEKTTEKIIQARPVQELMRKRRR